MTHYPHDLSVASVKISGGFFLATFNQLLSLNPSVATFAGSTWQPVSRIDSATFSRDSGSVRKTTHPPPPAPQTLAESAPLWTAAPTIFSISGVVIPGALVLRSFHSSRMSRA